MNKHFVFLSEIVPNTAGPSSTGNPTSVKIGHVPEDAINNAVAMTIRSTDLSEVKQYYRNSTIVIYIFMLDFYQIWPILHG